MLVLSRKENERVCIEVGDVKIWVSLNSIRGNRARLGFEIENGDARIHREEVVRKIWELEQEEPVSGK